jgi:hypothetical protein
MSTFKDEIVNEILQMNKVNNPTYKFKFLVPRISSYSMDIEEFHIILDFDTFNRNTFEEDFETTQKNWKLLTDPKNTHFDITRLGKLYNTGDKYMDCYFSEREDETYLHNLKIFAQKVSQEII